MGITKANYKILCACGCGILINAFGERGEPRKWAVGHCHRKMRKKVPCACGCGTIIDAVSKSGTDKRFVLGHFNRTLSAEKCSAWRGGCTIDANGYVWVRSVGHRKATKKGHYVREHILVMEAYLNACLCDWTEVHHKNEIRTDNRIENLEMMTKEKHMFIHGVKKALLGLMPPRNKRGWIKRRSV